jgi:hypothetical protein
MSTPPAAEMTSHTGGRDDWRAMHSQTWIVIVGLLVWAGAVIALSAPVAARIMLLAPTWTHTIRLARAVFGPESISGHFGDGDTPALVAPDVFPPCADWSCSSGRRPTGRTQA